MMKMSFDSSKMDHYQPKLIKEVMHIMGGFEKKEAYYVPRIVLNVPWSDEYLCKALFPNWPTWCEEVSSEFGDEYAKIFVLELLPFFARVAVQDGIYWLDDFPSHPCSNLIKQSLRSPTPYEQWASRARTECTELERTQPNNRVEIMSDAVVHSNNQLARRQDRYHRVQLGLLNSLASKMDGHQREHRALLQKVWEISNSLNAQQTLLNNMYSLLNRGKFFSILLRSLFFKIRRINKKINIGFFYCWIKLCQLYAHWHLILYW